MSDHPDGAAVWTYWEDAPGRTRAVYLDLCLETIRLHSAPLEMRLVGRDDVQAWLPDIDMAVWEKLPAPNYRSDYVRSRVLQRYGGVWIDIDTVALGPLPDLVSEVDHTGIVCFGQEHGRFFGGLCAAVAGAPFVDAWVDGQARVLSRNEDWSTLGYAALAQDVTWHTARRHPWKAIPMSRVAPIPWYQWRRFLSRVESPARLLKPHPLTVVLWNAVMAPSLRRYDRPELLSSRILLGRLLRIALGLSDADAEEDVLTKFHGLSAMRFSNYGERVETAARRLGVRREPG